MRCAIADFAGGIGLLLLALGGLGRRFSRGLGILRSAFWRWACRFGLGRSGLGLRLLLDDLGCVAGFFGNIGLLPRVDVGLAGDCRRVRWRELRDTAAGTSRRWNPRSLPLLSAS